MTKNLVTTLEVFNLNAVAKVYWELSEYRTKDLNPYFVEIQHLIALLSLEVPLSAAQAKTLNESAAKLSAKLRGEYVAEQLVFDPEFQFESALRQVLITSAT